jgi:DNA-binding transcriptional regulator YdaS (Cro superfamily)
MLIITNNDVKLAVSKAGGATKTSNLLGVSNGVVHVWIRERRVPNIDLARKLAEISGMKLEQVRPV